MPSPASSTAEPARIAAFPTNAPAGERPAEGWMDKEQAMAFLGISHNTLMVWMRARGDRGGAGLPFVKFGKIVRFRRAALEAWGAQNETNHILPFVA